MLYSTQKSFLLRLTNCNQMLLYQFSFKMHTDRYVLAVYAAVLSWNVEDQSPNSEFRNFKGFNHHDVFSTHHNIYSHTNFKHEGVTTVKYFSLQMWTNTTSLQHYNLYTKQDRTMLTSKNTRYYNVKSVQAFKYLLKKAHGKIK